MTRFASLYSRSPPNHSNRATTSEVSGGVDTIDRTTAQCRSDRLRSGPRQAPRRSLRRNVGQAVTAGLRFWRGRRLRGALSAAVVDPGLRPRFFSVLPTPANFRSR
jgi:hypothetical protein